MERFAEPKPRCRAAVLGRSAPAGPTGAPVLAEAATGSVGYSKALILDTGYGLV